MESTTPRNGWWIMAILALIGAIAAITNAYNGCNRAEPVTPTHQSLSEQPSETLENQE